MIQIGLMGEQYARTATIDVAEYLEQWPGSTPQLFVIRPGEQLPYIAVTSMDGTNLVWEASAYDTEKQGLGQAQVFFVKHTGGGDIALLGKSELMTIQIGPALPGTSEAEIPDPYDSWAAVLAGYAADAIAAKEAAEAALNEFTTPTASATTLDPGEEATAAYSNGHFSFGIPRGYDGSGGGGGGTSDYTQLTNKPKINNVTLSGSKSLADLGIAAASDIPTVPVQSVNNKTGDVVLSASDLGAYVKPVTGIPAEDLASGVVPSVPSAYTNPAADLAATASAGSATTWARGDHVHKKPTYTAADVGLGNVDNVQQYSAGNPPPYPVTSVNGSTGAVVLTIPDAAAIQAMVDAAMCYKDGDTYKADVFVAGAYTNNDGDGLHFAVILPKWLNNISSVTVTSLKGRFVSVDGVIESSTTSTQWVTKTGCTVTAGISSENAVKIQVMKSSALSGATAKTVAAYYGEVTLTFSE